MVRERKREATHKNITTHTLKWHTHTPSMTYCYGNNELTTCCQTIRYTIFQLLKTGQCMCGVHLCIYLTLQLPAHGIGTAICILYAKLIDLQQFCMVEDLFYGFTGLQMQLLWFVFICNRWHWNVHYENWNCSFY